MDNASKLSRVALKCLVGIASARELEEAVEELSDHYTDAPDLFDRFWEGAPPERSVLFLDIARRWDALAYTNPHVAAAASDVLVDMCRALLAREL